MWSPKVRRFASDDIGMDLLWGEKDYYFEETPGWEICVDRSNRLKGIDQFWI